MIAAIRIYIALIMRFGIRKVLAAIAEARRRTKAESQTTHTEAFNATFNRFSVVR